MRHFFSFNIKKNYSTIILVLLQKLKTLNSNKVRRNFELKQFWVKSCPLKSRRNSIVVVEEEREIWLGDLIKIEHWISDRDFGKKGLKHLEGECSTSETGQPYKGQSQPTEYFCSFKHLVFTIVLFCSDFLSFIRAIVILSRGFDRGRKTDPGRFFLTLRQFLNSEIFSYRLRRTLKIKI